jgi:NADP-dependent 3-hydroxy acid dehydrogenase YdfG
MSVFNASRLAGKTVLLTGASSGIGMVRGSAFCGQAQTSHGKHPGHRCLVR